MSRPLNTQQEKEELRRRIRGLTTILHRFMAQKDPSEQPDTRSFLHYFTTLLTSSEDYDTDARRVIAVTASLDPGRPMRILIAAMDPHAPSSAPPVFLRLMQNCHKPLGEVVAGPPHPELMDHISDTWAALSAVDRRATYYAEQLASLEIFFLWRNFRKFTVRFRQDICLCGGQRLAKLIGQWKADRPEITLRWVTPPKWLVRIEGLPKIRSRTAGGRLEWEFSDKTKRDWSMILVTLLSSMDRSIESVKRAREMGKEIETLNLWCRRLYYFITWEAGIVKDLLTKTNMVDDIDIPTKFVPIRTSETVGEYDNGSAGILPELGESKGNQVLRYLCTVIAWHEAINTLCDNETLPEFLKNIEIGLVQVPPSPSSVPTLSEISDEFFIRFPAMMASRRAVLKILERRHSDDMFCDFVHPEAALMGLLNHYSAVEPDQDVELWDAQIMQQVVQPVAKSGKAVIAATQKCCWCCHWLGQKLESQFTLPGTHGVMFPWDPPKVGVSKLVLEKLEEELWNQLREVMLRSLLYYIPPPETYIPHA